MNFKITHDLPPILTNNDWVCLDIELFGAEKHKLHRPTTGVFACLSVCYRPDLVHVILDVKQLPKVIYSINNAVWIFHNAYFDITHLRRWVGIFPRKKIWDVMIIEREMCGGLYESYSLEDIVRRRLNILMEKEIRDTFSNSVELTNEQIHYSATDAVLTWLVCESQKKEIDKKTYKVWTEIDRKAFWPILDFSGFRLDQEKWLALASENQKRADEIASKLSFNPASPKQVLGVLRKSGFRNIKTTDEQHLQAMILKNPDSKASEIAQSILEYRTYAKRASTYGKAFIDKYLEDEGGYGVIHPGYWVCGAETGRTSSSNPNFQTIPTRDTKEFRECFIARPGNKLVIADMGQQETRIAAYLSQDKNLIEILQDKGQDIFVGMARMIYKKDIDKSDPFRKQVKNTTYGILYGMSASGMAERYGMSKEDAESAINDFFNTFHGLYNWVEKQKRKRDYVETISGRRIYLNPYSFQVERNAVNSPIQGTAADQMKIALGNIYEKWRDVFGVNIMFCCVGYIHDELIFDVYAPKAKELGEFVSKEMVSAAEALCPGVPFIADYKICDNWSEKE